MDKILVVDDKEENLLLLEKILAPFSYNIFKALSAEEALKVLAKENIGLVLSDVNMPDTSGYELCKQIKSNELTRNIPVVLVTAEKRELEDMVFGLDIGADEYLIKPYDTAVLIARVRSMLRVKTLNDKLVEAERLKAIAQLAITANHEINGALTGVIGNAEVLQITEGVTEEEKQEKLEVIIKQGYKISDILKKMSEITEPVKTNYLPGIEMIDLNQSKFRE